LSANEYRVTASWTALLARIALMADDRRYFVGERVLVSRAQDGENHEEATVVDFYELLIEGDKIPSVVVDFDDGERLYLTAREPGVMPIELDDSDADEDEDADEDAEDADDFDGDEDDEEVPELDADDAFRGDPAEDEEDDE
jgi:hypothetical protein